MGAELRTTILSQMTGLGKMLEFAETFVTTTTLTVKSYIYQIQAVADETEKLSLGDVGTPELIIIKCISNDVDIDTSFDAEFSPEITVHEGEVAVFKPYGTVYINSHNEEEAVTIETLVVGTA